MPPSFGPLAILNGTCLVALLFILLNIIAAQPPEDSESESATIHHHAPARLSLKLERFLSSLADYVSPFEEDVWEESALLQEEDREAEDETRPVLTHTGYFGGEASLFVERTEAYHASRPSLFGPHLHKSLSGTLVPYSHQNNYACPSPPADHGQQPPSDSQLEVVVGDNEGRPDDWIALIERGGGCAFADKVRAAQHKGANAVVVGNSARYLDSTGSLLISMWSPGDTKDIMIPSVFVSSKSFLELTRVLQDARENDELEDGGLKVIMSKEDILSWDMSDVLRKLLVAFVLFAQSTLLIGHTPVAMLFLPSMLTLATLLSHHVSLYRSQRLERAPKEVVESLPWVQWGVDPVSSAVTSTTTTSSGGQQQQQARRRTTQEEQEDQRRDLEEAPPTHRSESSRSSSTSPERASTRRSWTNVWLWSHRLRTWNPLHRNKKVDGAIDATIHPPAAFSTLQQSNRFAGQESSCAICLCAYEHGEAVRWLPCAHLLHASCVDPWLLRTSRCCPLCRFPVESEAISATQSPGGSNDLPQEQHQDSDTSPATTATPARPEAPSVGQDIQQGADRSTEQTPLLSRSMPNL